jgi:two-component system, chemotaxis family, CheB/CheR fusion protein
VRDGATFVMRIRPYRAVNDVIAGAVITFVDITERKRYEEERARLAAIIDSSHDAIIGHSLDRTITSWNAGAQELFGYTSEEAIGKPLSILVPEDQPDDVPQILERLARGEHIVQFESHRAAKGGKPVDVSITISPVRDASGAMMGAATIARDASERRRSEELRALLVDELNHRVKNTLATVQSIAAQSLKGISEGESRETFDARLVSLSWTHDLLARDSWESASLRDLLLQELEPYRAEDGTRFVVDGPDFGLRPKAALALGLALHELATNAAKYGALSTPQGRVRVTWDVGNASAPGALRLKWAETGGPPVKNTGHKGFGSVLIERGLALELDARVELDFGPGGLGCTIEIPLGGEEATDG